MKASYAIAIAGLICVGCRHSTLPSSSAARGAEPKRILREIEGIVPAVSAPASDRETLALLPAHFSDRNAETGPTLSGQDLYLFPDGSYFFLRWADIEPPTIYDKGRWSFRGGLVSLQSDHSAPQDIFPYSRDTAFVPFYHKVSGERTLLLMGTRSQFSYFKENGTDSDAHMLFLCSLTRAEAIDPSSAAVLKRKIYEESWIWDLFKK